MAFNQNIKISDFLHKYLPVFHVLGNYTDFEKVAKQKQQSHLGLSYKVLTVLEGLEGACWLPDLWTHAREKLTGGTGEDIYE